MALIPKVEPKQEKTVVSAPLDDEMHTMLQRHATFLGVQPTSTSLANRSNACSAETRNSTNGSQRMKQCTQPIRSPRTRHLRA